MFEVLLKVTISKVYYILKKACNPKQVE